MHELLAVIMRKKWLLIINSVVIGALGFLFSTKILSGNRVERIVLAVSGEIELHPDIIYINSWDIKWINNNTVMMAGDLLRQQIGEVFGNIDDLKKIKMDTGDAGLLDIRGYYDPYKRKYNLFLTENAIYHPETTQDIIARIETRVTDRFLDKVRLEVERKLAKLRSQEMRMVRIIQFSKISHDYKFQSLGEVTEKLSLNEVRGELRDLSSHDISLRGLKLFKTEATLVSENSSLKRSIVFGFLCALSGFVFTVLVIEYPILQCISKTKNYEV